MDNVATSNEKAFKPLTPKKVTLSPGTPNSSLQNKWLRSHLNQTVNVYLRPPTPDDKQFKLTGTLEAYDSFSILLRSKTTLGDERSVLVFKHAIAVMM